MWRDLAGKADSEGFRGGVSSSSIVVELVKKGETGGWGEGRGSGNIAGGRRTFERFFELVLIFNGDFDLVGFSSQHLLCNLLSHLTMQLLQSLMHLRGISV